MSDDELDAHQDHDADQSDSVEPPLTWSHLGTTAPRVPHRRARAHRDLGPGGSHQQEADRARALRRPRRWHGVPIARALLAASAVAILAALVCVVIGSFWPTFVGVLLALGGAVSLAAGIRVHLERPTAEKRLIARARAERRIAAELDPLAVSGWVLLHDRVLVGGEHRLAHVAVGPAGVFVIEPLPPGPLRIVGEQTAAGDGRELYVGPMHLGQWLDTRRWEVIQLEPAIAGGLADMVWTGPTSAVAVQVPDKRWWEIRREPRDAVPEMPYDWAGVTFRPFTALVETLATLPAPLDRAAVAQLATVVEKLCPPAGRVDDAHGSSENNPG